MSMVKSSGEFTYLEKGQGKPIILLHGLMGGVENFGDMVDFISNEFKVYGLDLKLFETPYLKCSVKNKAEYLLKFMDHLKIESATLLGNSMGGHIGLVFTKLYPKRVDSLILTGSSGLYESAFGNSFPRRGDYDYIKTKTEEVFYDPKIATKEIVDDVFASVNDREKLIRTLSLAKSAIRHNMAKDLPKMNTKTLIIWGKQDSVTPPNVAEDFNKLLPNSDLSWIDKCGHAPMMEHPNDFNKIMENWLSKNNL